MDAHGDIFTFMQKRVGRCRRRSPSPCGDVRTTGAASSQQGPRSRLPDKSGPLHLLLAQPLPSTQPQHSRPPDGDATSRSPGTRPTSALSRRQWAREPCRAGPVGPLPQRKLYDPHSRDAVLRHEGRPRRDRLVERQHPRSTPTTRTGRCLVTYDDPTKRHGETGASSRTSSMQVATDGSGQCVACSTRARRTTGLTGRRLPAAPKPTITLRRPLRRLHVQLGRQRPHRSLHRTHRARAAAHTIDADADADAAPHAAPHPGCDADPHSHADPDARRRSRLRLRLRLRLRRRRRRRPRRAEQGASAPLAGEADAQDMSNRLAVAPAPPPSGPSVSTAPRPKASPPSSQHPAGLHRLRLRGRHLPGGRAHRDGAP